MANPLKQFVPSSVCLKCDGCCRFQFADSPWRPKVGENEMTQGVDAKGYVKTTPAPENHQCLFFNKVDHTCGVYQHRPLECSLYPFILSKTPEGIKVFVHLACPYIQENEINKNFDEYTAYLKEYFAQKQTKDFLKNNNRLLHDYSDVEKELRFLFDIEV